MVSEIVDLLSFANQVEHLLSSVRLRQISQSGWIDVWLSKKNWASLSTRREAPSPIFRLAQ